MSTSGAGGKRLGKSGRGDGSGLTAVRRLGLIVFGAAFLILFALVAVAEGLGDPDVPSGDVAVVEDAPGDTGEVTEAEFNRALDQSAAAAGVKEVPKPGDPQYEEIREGALTSLFEGIWIQGLADEQGITVSDKELDEELQNAIDQSFGGSKAEFKKFLKEAHYTDADVDEKVKLQALSGKLQKHLEDAAPEPSEDEVEDYYEAAKALQFTNPATRDVRLILNQEEEKAEKALARLERGNSEKDWERVAKEYSEDPPTKENGGLRLGVMEGTFEEPLDAAIFKAAEGKLEGPLKAPKGFYVFEVEGSTPESFQELKDVEAGIKSTLAEQLKQEFFAAFVADFQLKWKMRTFCAADYLTESCGNFEGDAHPEGAVPTCYEEDPKDGLPAEGCPAPVTQLMPALPGSVTPLEPKGKPMAQRPQPVPGEQTEEAAAVPAPLE